MAAGIARATKCVVNGGGANYGDAARKAECRLLDAQIERWDAMARQPQSAQTRDWISAQRKQARDRQFRLRCQ